MQTETINTIFGTMIITSDANRLVEINFSGEKSTSKQIEDIYQYLRHKYLPINVDQIEGTDFQKKVWLEVLKIPYGDKKTYQEIAERIGHKQSYRAVANACGKNNLALAIPCHRVVSKNKKDIRGYKWGIALKKRLLDHENK